MRALDLIAGALEMTEQNTLASLSDMHDAPLTRPSPGSGNHPMWIVGHLAFVESSMPAIVSGELSPLASWAPLFATGSSPVDDARAYPEFEEVVSTYQRLRGATKGLLQRVGEAGLDRAPAWVPPGLEDAMTSIGAAFHLLALHQMFHQGQIADARRAAGRPIRM